MVVKANVRQRRQDRIKEISEKQRVSIAHDPYHLPFGEDELYPTNRGDYVRGGDSRETPGKSDDPEWVWKRKVNQGWSHIDQDERRRIEHEQRWREWMEPPTRGQMRGKLLFCAVLFGLVWGMFQISHPWAVQGQAFVTKALTEPYSFEAMKQWYGKLFEGAPSFIPVLGIHQQERSYERTSLYPPVLGAIVTPFSSTNQGVVVETKAHSPISALGTGRVMYVGQTANAGLTVIIQHADQTQSVYGWVEQCLVQKNDWVEGGAQIGNVAARDSAEKGRLYFAVKQQNKYVDPAEVIAFD